MEKNKTARAAATVLVALAAACTPKPPAEKKPTPDYQMPMGKVAQSSSKACYDATSLNTVNIRMTQGEMAVGYLTCQNADGTRKFNTQYADVVSKFAGELSTNSAEIKPLLARRRLNLDAVVTEFANREAQRRNDDPQFCSRMERAFAWALSPAVTSLSQVPSPHDLGPEMNVLPCAK